MLFIVTTQTLGGRRIYYVVAENIDDASAKARPVIHGDLKSIEEAEHTPKWAYIVEREEQINNRSRDFFHEAKAVDGDGKSISDDNGELYMSQSTSGGAWPDINGRMRRRLRSLGYTPVSNYGNDVRLVLDRKNAPKGLARQKLLEALRVHQPATFGELMTHTGLTRVQTTNALAVARQAREVEQDERTDLYTLSGWRVEVRALPRALSNPSNV